MSIDFSELSWRYVIDEQTQIYVPVARISREQKWRRVCIMYDDPNVQYLLCGKFFRQKLKLASKNVIYSEVWLTRVHEFYGYTTMLFDNIVKGNCYQYGRELLLLSGCKKTGMYLTKLSRDFETNKQTNKQTTKQIKSKTNKQKKTKENNSKDKIQYKHP